MGKTITIPLEKYKRLCGCLVESQEIIESLGVREFVKAPKLSKKQKLELKMQNLLETGYRGKNKK